MDVLGELEKLRKQAMQPAAGARSTGATPVPSAAAIAAAAAAGGAGTAGSPAGGVGGNGRGELSRNIDMTLKREDFQRARRVLVSFQVEDDQHRVVDAVRDLPVDIKDAAGLHKLLLQLNISLHAKE
jgi:hypothetical protein